MTAIGKNLPSFRRFWPGYLLIVLGIVWAIWELVGQVTPENWLLFLIFLVAGLFCFWLGQTDSVATTWLKELGLFFLVGSLGYFSSALNLFHVAPIGDFWGLALSVIFIRIFFKNPAYLLIYFLAVLVFLFAVSHFLSTQFALDRNLNGALFLFGFGLSFLYLYLISSPGRESHWSLIPGILLTFLGLFFMSIWDPRPAVKTVSAFELIFLGVWLIWAANKSGKKTT